MKILKFKKLILSLFAVAMTGALTSCNDLIYEDEGDCTVTYSLGFVYDMNLKWADAFPSEVKSVNVFAFDEEGKFVKEFADSSEGLSVAGYRLDLDLEPGKYTLVGWCGLVNDGKVQESFSLSNLEPGVTTLDEFTCRLNSAYDEELGEVSKERLKFLYHGKIDVELVDEHDGAHHHFLMPLTKDTNHFRIMLQQIGSDIDYRDFTISMESANGLMGYDNSLLGDTRITYRPWKIQNDVLSVGNDDSRAAEYYGVVADLTLARLMENDEDNLILSVTYNKDGNTQKFSVPVVKYCLLMKEYYEEEYNRPMSVQEYLDRQDEYVITFFLDEGMQWRYLIVEIHSWRIIRYRVDLE